MKLTDHQQKMLDGAFGRGKAMAMQIQIGVGKCFDAERLVRAVAERGRLIEINNNSFVAQPRARIPQRAGGRHLVCGQAPGRGGFLRHRADCQPRLFRRLFSFSAD